MYRKLIHFVAFVLILAVSAKVTASLHRSFTDKKAVIVVSESNESKEDTSASDESKDKAEAACYISPLNREVVITINASFFNTNARPLLSRHFFAVPTPPPWA